MAARRRRPSDATRRSWRAGAVACLLALAVTGGARVAAQRASASTPPTLPPLVMTCPHHPDVVEDRPGSCPMCQMALVPARIDGAWMCPVHTAVTESSRGSCRLCGRARVQVAVSLTWTCRAGGSEHLEPGLCPDGTPRVMRRALRPHGNHNPQYGGQFFMAPDSWHHLEGTLPDARVFRLHVYDDYARSLDRGLLKAVEARVVTRESYDPRSRKTTEIVSFPLKLARDGRSLEARIDPLAMPAEMTAKVRFARDAPEYRFDFTFDSLTKAPGDDGQTRTVPAVRATPRPAATRAAAPEAPSPAAAPSMPELLAALRRRSSQTGELIARGDFGNVWIPAFAAKDLALTLEPHLAHLPAPVRGRTEPALRQVVRAAWQLDAIADAGDRLRIEEAYRALEDAVARSAAGFEEAVTP